jgi:hypothetical protein
LGRYEQQISDDVLVSVIIEASRQRNLAQVELDFGQTVQEEEVTKNTIVATNHVRN